MCVGATLRSDILTQHRRAKMNVIFSGPTSTLDIRILLRSDGQDLDRSRLAAFKEEQPKCQQLGLSPF